MHKLLRPSQLLGEYSSLRWLCMFLTWETRFVLGHVVCVKTNASDCDMQSTVVKNHAFVQCLLSTYECVMSTRIVWDFALVQAFFCCFLLLIIFGLVCNELRVCSCFSFALLNIISFFITFYSILLKLYFNISSVSLLPVVLKLQFCTVLYKPVYVLSFYLYVHFDSARQTNLSRFLEFFIFEKYVDLKFQV